MFVSTSSSSAQLPTVATLFRSFAQNPSLPFADALPEEQIKQLCREEGVDFASEPDAIWTPSVTVWTWLTQCLSGSKSCVAAVARVLVLRVGLDLPLCSANSGAYCKARSKLPERFLQRLTLQVGEAIEDSAPADWRWKGRRVTVVDGTECSMPDTAANQKEYPQPSTQKKGLGFPMIRLLVLLTFATAGVIGCAMGPYQGKQTGETALLRSLSDCIRVGDVLVSDRYHCSFWHVAGVKGRGADVCARLHQKRKYDFSTGERLGAGDHVVHWTKPAARPEWMDEETYASFPATLTVREVHFVVTWPGYRSKEIVVATTLLDARVYAKEDIAELYHHRWHVELDIRAIKQTLHMDILSCKTPEMVRKEIWAHLLAYNLIRKVMAQAAMAAKTTPRHLSFAGAVQTVSAFRWLLVVEQDERRRLSLTRALLVAVGTHKVGDRPGRYEPRKKKRRPGGLPLLTKPRTQARAELLEQGAA